METLALCLAWKRYISSPCLASREDDRSSCYFVFVNPFEWLAPLTRPSSNFPMISDVVFPLEFNGPPPIRLKSISGNRAGAIIYLL